MTSFGSELRVTKPENKDLEKYVFLRCYDMDLEMAMHTIKILRRYRRQDVRYALLRDIVISYCRPFSKNNGKSGKKHTYKTKYLSKEMQSFHKELMALRDKLFGHTDLDYKDPKITKWTKGDDKWFPMSFKQLDYDALLLRISKIEELIGYVQSDLRKRIKNCEVDL